MRADGCTEPISADQVFDYWAGELHPHDEASLEAHVFACPGCGDRLAEGEALARAIRLLVGSGAFHAPVSDAVLNRLARDGVRVRTFALSPGDVVPCAVWDADEVIVTRLRGDFSGLHAVAVVATLDSGEELSRSSPVPLHPGQQEVVEAMSAAWLRQLPAATVRLRVLTADTGAQLAEYTLTHAGSLSRR